jgi:hypothetical protein
VGMGSKLIRGEWVKSGNFEAIQQSAQATLELIRSIRAEKR